MYDGPIADGWEPEPEPFASKPVRHIEQRLCIVCGLRTLIKLYWYLFQREHHGCDGDAWACYACKARTRNGFWYVPEPSVIHTECGYGGRV